MAATPVQGAFGISPAPAASFAVTLPNPTTKGNVLVVSVRFASGPAPILNDSFGNPRQVCFIANGAAFGLWEFDVLRGGGGHSVTVVSTSGPQSFEVGVEELAIGPAPGTTKGLLTDIRDLLQKIATAERAIP
jgi:hypothetical protein